MALDALAALHGAILERLVNDPAVGALAPVVHETPPSEAVPPFLSIAPLAAEDRSTKTAQAFGVRIALRLVLDVQGDADALATAEMVRRTLDGTSLAIAGNFRLVRLDLRNLDIIRPRNGGREVRLRFRALLVER